MSYVLIGIAALVGLVSVALGATYGQAMAVTCAQLILNWVWYATRKRRLN